MFPGTCTPGIHYHWLLRDSGASKPIPLAPVTRPLPILLPGSWAFCHERFEAEDDERDCIRENRDRSVCVWGVTMDTREHEHTACKNRSNSLSSSSEVAIGQQSLPPSADTL